MQVIRLHPHATASRSSGALLSLLNMSNPESRSTSCCCATWQCSLLRLHQGDSFTDGPRLLASNEAGVNRSKSNANSSASPTCDTFCRS